MKRRRRSDRRELHSLRRRISRRLESEIRRRTGPAEPELERYEARYRRALRSPSSRMSTKALERQLLGAEVILCGDYHTFRPAQAFCVALLRRMAEASPRVVLLLELAHSAHQHHLDDWIDGRLEESELLRRLDYRRNWGFPWSGYRPLFEMARAEGIRIVGLNGPGLAQRNSLAARDGWASEVIARSAEQNPGARLLAMVGDLHLAPGHLPAALRAALLRRNLERKLFVVHQSPDDVYWRMLATGKEPVAARLARDRACIFTGSPWAKLESFLTWLECGDDPVGAELGLSGEDGIEYSERILDLLDLLGRFLDIETGGAECFSVYTADDLGFLEQLRAEGLGQRAELDLLDRDCELMPGIQAIWLSRLDLGNAARAAAELLLHLVSPAAPTASASSGPAFYRHALRATAIRFAQLLLDPFAVERRGHRGALGDALIGAHARVVLRVLQGEGGRAAEAGLGVAVEDDSRLGRGISDAIGQVLGARLYSAFQQGSLSRDEAREILLGCAAGEAGRERLQELHRELARFEVLIPSQALPGLDATVTPLHAASVGLPAATGPVRLHRP